jgi:hypothetical protein
MTLATLLNVRVDVHLDNGIELSPTSPITLKPGEATSVNIEASKKSFTGW